VRLAAGQTLFHDGDPATLVYNLTKGTLKLYKLLPNGRRQVTGFLFPGAFLGAVSDQNHGFSAECMEAVELCGFPRNRFEAFAARHAGLERALYRTATRELAAAYEQVALLGRKNAAERLASFLIRFFEGKEEARVPMTRADIADYLGVTKETVSRTFSGFRSSGLIRMSAHDRIELLHLERLEELASGFSA
jgi:CRP/FNR family transcriptional regulator, anaerobic regulatory protein